MMKALRITVLGVMALGLVSAQGRGPGRPGDGTPPTAADMVQRRVQMLTRRLSLTDAQQQQATTIFTQAATASEANRASLKTVMDQMQTAVKANDTARIDQLSITLGTLSGQLAGTERKAEAAFYAILTAEQKAKFDERGFGMGPGGMGMGGPGGPRPMRAPRQQPEQ